MNATKLLEQILESARFFGRELTEKALILVYALFHPGTPNWARVTIFSALAYLLLPLDACPDWIPVAGLADDAAALVAAISSVIASITPDVVVRAKETADRIFGIPVGDGNLEDAA